MVNATLDGQKSGQGLQVQDPGTTVKLADVTVQNCLTVQGAAIYASGRAVLEAMRSKFKQNTAQVTKASWRIVEHGRRVLV